MPGDSLGLVELLQILFLLGRQDLARRRDRLVQALEAAEANDGAGHALVDPSQGNMRDLFAFVRIVSSLKAKAETAPAR